MRPQKLTRIFAVAALACLIGACVPSAAENPSQLQALNPVQDASATYPVQGVVLNSLTHQPIPRALVDATTDATLTDGDGHFELNLPAGVMQITTRRPGYISDGRSTHAVRVAPEMPGLTFYLSPTATITARVTLSTGEDASAISFTVFRRGSFNGHERWSQQGNAVTNSEGILRIEDIESPASYILCSSPSHDLTTSLPTSADVTFGFPSICYPETFSSAADTSNLSSANLLNVAPGQQAEVSITLTREPFYRTSIAVPDHSPAQGVYVQIRDAGGRPLEYWSHWNPQQGIAQVSLPNGQYYAEARSNGATSSYGRVDFKVANAPISGLSMMLHPLRPLLVHLHRDFTVTDPQSIAIGNGGSPDGNAGLNLNLANVDSLAGEMGGGLQPARGATDPNLFQVENVVPGRYWVETFPFSGYVTSITSGGVDLARQPLVIGTGDTAAPIEVTLRNDGGQIKGTINQPQTSSAAPTPELNTTFIYAIPAFPTTSPLQRTESQNALPFVFSNLAPGRYKIVATDKEIDPNDTLQLAPYAARGQAVTIQSSGTENLQLDIVPAFPASASEGSDQ